MWINLNDPEIQLIKDALTPFGGDAGKRQLFERIESRKDAPDDAKYRAAAKKKARNGELGIDNDAVVSKGGDPGAYVMSWIWVYDSEAGIEEESSEVKEV